MSHPAWLTAQDYAHRGLHDAHLPENTLGAFAAAIDAGLGIELDVRLSADGIAVVVHDSDLTRLTGRPGRVDDMTAAALRGVTVGANGQHIPTLAEALTHIADRAPVLVEIKNTGLRTGGLERAVAADLAARRGRAAVMSWNLLSVMWFRRNAPDIPRGLVVTGLGDGRHFSGRLLLQAAHALPAARIADAAFLAHDVRRLPTRLSRRYRRAGRPVLTWTVRSDADWVAARTHADAAICERVM